MFCVALDINGNLATVSNQSVKLTQQETSTVPPVNIHTASSSGGGGLYIIATPGITQSSFVLSGSASTPSLSSLMPTSTRSPATKNNVFMTALNVGCGVYQAVSKHAYI